MKKIIQFLCFHNWVTKDGRTIRNFGGIYRPGGPEKIICSKCEKIKK